MVDGRNFSDQLVKNSIRTYENIKNITTGQCDDYKTGCIFDYLHFSDYLYFKENYNLIGIDLIN